MFTGIGLILGVTAGVGARQVVTNVCKSVAPTGMSFAKALTYSAGTIGLATIAGRAVEFNIRAPFDKVEEDRKDLINSL